MKNKINHIWVFRQSFKKLSTRGQMYLNGVFKGYTLEDEVRGEGVKVKHHTAIKADTYQVVKHSSKKFPKALRIENVDDFVGILIHAGNTEKHTDGCILVGKTKSDGVDEDTIGNSTAVTKALTAKIWSDIQKGIPCYITITDSPDLK
jgi:hypothetical protein